VRRLFEPSKFAPIAVDFRRVLLTGIALWTGTLAVVGALTMLGVSTGHGVGVCVTGIALGGIALVWEHFNRARTRP
jgi:hypothetical protein